MTKEELAAKLTGREYGSEITEAEEKEAKAANLVVIFGYSDDNVEIRGKFDDEITCYAGGEMFLHSDGILNVSEAEDCDRCRRRMIETKKLCRKVELVWGKKGYSWTYNTEVPHATFEIVEDGRTYCRGIVLDAGDLPKVDVD